MERLQLFRVHALDLALNTHDFEPERLTAAVFDVSFVAEVV